MNKLHESSFVLSLRDIDAWSSPSDLPRDFPQIVAAIPALQRGLVWKPKQIEILWDSLLRGIPIGSFVVCDKLGSQMRSQQQGEERVTHHLLDGQQRANAIHLGFAAFPSDDSPILWIDLAPFSDPGSTRNYLLRLTTLAHPWGYTRADSDGRLTASEIRNAIAERTDAASPNRPPPCELKPFQAKVPVPLSILLRADPNSEALFWSSVNTSLAGFSKPWAKSARTHIEQTLSGGLGDSHSFLTKLFMGVQRVNAARIIALNAPAELLQASQMETIRSQQSENQSDITNIEHLFQRLNQQGTRLDGEELAYSLIKAYWPEIADDVDDAARNRMPASRMATLAFRCVLSQEVGKLHAPITVSYIRKLSQAVDDSKRKQVIAFIRDDLEAVCKRVDRWLGLEPWKDDKLPAWGLLKVHRTFIAIQSPEVYLLLLWLAWRHPNPDIDLFPRITGLATLMSWFGRDQGKLANIICQHTQDQFGHMEIDQALSEGSACLMTVLHPLDLLQLMSLPPLDAIKFDPNLLISWDWESLHTNVNQILPHAEEEARKRSIEAWWPSLCAVMYLRHAGQQLLLYAQRKYLAERFPEYDPARRDLWEAHNRPWDFDHILPHKYTYYQQGDYRPVCAKWVGMIGNLRAVPFEENRSDLATPAAEKITTPKAIADSFLTETSLQGFNQAHAVLHKPEIALSFITACRDRIVDIYREWYDSLDIQSLVPPALYK